MWSTHLGPKIRFLLLSDCCGFVNVGRPLWREDGSVVYDCYWASPAESFSGPSSEGLITIFYCLRFDIPPTWRARSSYLYSPGRGWHSCTPRYWVPFSSPPTTRRVTVEVFDPASTRGDPSNCNNYLVLVITSGHGLRRKHVYHYCCLLSLPWKHACLRSR
jgi:hypothetical protein